MTILLGAVDSSNLCTEPSDLLANAAWMQFIDIPNVSQLCMCPAKVHPVTHAPVSRLHALLAAFQPCHVLGKSVNTHA